MIAEEILEIEGKIADLKKQLPAHSVPPGMLIEIEDLEEQLKQLQDLHQAEKASNA